MSAPSNLPSAAWVSRRCFDARCPIETLNPSLREHVDQLAAFFHQRGDLETTFIPLVPWNELVGPPNQGHAAVADLLISRAANAALSANFDPIIEHWAQEHKVAMRGALNAQEAVTFPESSPLIKFHGCTQRSRESTLWTQGQLTDPSVQARVASCTDWMNVHLPGKHLVVVGFWTDWPHLNDAFANAFTIRQARAVTVIDPLPVLGLQSKAPLLWERLNNLSSSFEHIQSSGADALEELRTAFSKAWVRKFYAMGQGLIDADADSGQGAVMPSVDALSGEELFNLRRDAEGVPYNRAAKIKEPASNAATAAAMYLMLLDAGAVQQGAVLQHNGLSIRVVNGAGRGIAQVKEEYVEPFIAQSDVVVCTGIDLGVPGRVIPTGQGASTVRPAHGGTSRWITFEQARTEFNL